MADRVNEFRPDSASPPGDTLAEVMQERGVSTAQLARKTGIPLRAIERILDGQAPITERVAGMLERELGPGARFWLRRQVQYEEAVRRGDGQGIYQ